MIAASGSLHTSTGPWEITWTVTASGSLTESPCGGPASPNEPQRDQVSPRGRGTRKERHVADPAPLPEVAPTKALSQRHQLPLPPRVVHTWPGTRRSGRSGRRPTKRRVARQNESAGTARDSKKNQTRLFFAIPRLKRVSPESLRLPR